MAISRRRARFLVLCKQLTKVYSAMEAAIASAATALGSKETSSKTCRQWAFHINAIVHATIWVHSRPEIFAELRIFDILVRPNDRLQRTGVCLMEKTSDQEIDYCEGLLAVYGIAILRRDLEKYQQIPDFRSKKIITKTRNAHNHPPMKNNKIALSLSILSAIVPQVCIDGFSRLCSSACAPFSSIDVD
ncbi:hypothetical protein VTP01DRAFT_2349 [Rhizomucor pusillus]|uniref:uncharacterized protein n=1 Tax=Rhizomucor pusillus TaxID=4840 RepID=UPI0037434115